MPRRAARREDPDEHERRPAAPAAARGVRRAGDLPGPGAAGDRPRPGGPRPPPRFGGVHRDPGRARGRGGRALRPGGHRAHGHAERAQPGRTGRGVRLRHRRREAVGAGRAQHCRRPRHPLVPRRGHVQRPGRRRAVQDRPGRPVLWQPRLAFTHPWLPPHRRDLHAGGGR